jgi:hypothetical protein
MFKDLVQLSFCKRCISFCNAFTGCKQAVIYITLKNLVVINAFKVVKDFPITSKKLGIF